MILIYSQTLLISLGILYLPITHSTCGYKSCPEVKDGYLNVHLVPHTHDDMGWLKTVDQYFYGANNSIQSASVQYILDSVIEELVKDSSRRFIFVEIGYFWRWWNEQSDEIKEVVKGLVESGRLEFINGGWCMNDEATAHYNEIIDQMTLGLRFLNETFGECGMPRVAWQIDPFGHSREQASLFAQMGFDGLFFGRLDYQDKALRELKKNMEMIWSGSPRNLGKSSWLFTGVLFNGYNPPNGFCWDIICNDNPVMDDAKLLDYNLDYEVKNFIEAIEDWSSAYQSNHILMTMGSDFQYMAARTWYKNLDKMIKYVNAAANGANGKQKINLIYSTPSCYLNELHKAGLDLEVKRDDFFPYASSNHSFWTGYFTSRPSLKYFVHKTNNFLQMCKNFGATEAADSKTLRKIFGLAEPMAVAQHHDAVAGTAKQHVTSDYALRLSIGIKQCEEVVANRIMFLLSERNREELSHQKSPVDGAYEMPADYAHSPKVSFCHQLNISACSATENMRNGRLYIYNPLTRIVEKTFLRLPVASEKWKVLGTQGDVIPTQILPLAQPVLQIPGRNSSAQFELIIPIKELQPLSITTLHIFHEESNEIFRASSKFRSIDYSTTSEPFISFKNNKGLGVTLDKETGLLRSISRFNGFDANSEHLNISQNFFYYNGMSREEKSQASGAYVFRPNGTSPLPVTQAASYTVHKGVHVTEIHQRFTNWISQTIRLYEDSDAIEFEYLIGPIPIEDGVGKEVITKYASDLKTNGVFYTDSNGREILKRKRNFRPTWDYEVVEPIAGNYYPINSRLILTERNQVNSPGKTLILLNDRAQGGSSINDGEMEIMLHRRLLVDDGWGVDEALNETEYGEGLVIRGKHWLVLAGGDTGVPTSIHRPMAQEIFRSPIFMFQETTDEHFGSTSTNEIYDNFPRNFQILDSKVSLTLPSNLHLLTFEKNSATEYLLRLEHFYENGEDEALSKKAVVPVKDLEHAFKFHRMVETTLSGNQWKSDSHRLQWNPKPDETLTHAEIKNKIKSYVQGDAVIEFQPMEIKTFVLYYN